MATKPEQSIHENNFSQFFLWPIQWATRLLFVLLILMLAAWCSYLVLMHFYWVPDSAVSHTRAILAHDLRVVSEFGSNSQAADLAVTTANTLYWLIWEITSIHDAMTAFSDPTPRGLLDTFLRNVLIVPFQAEIYVLMDATKIFGVRLAIFMSALPVFALAYVVGTTDGLVQRFIRRSCAGRESSGLYHRAKYFQLSGAAFLGLTYVCLPVAVDPRWVVLTSAGLLGVLARVQWSFYKKYL